MNFPEHYMHNENYAQHYQNMVASNQVTLQHQQNRRML